jgi:hypothetical protein
MFEFIKESVKSFVKKVNYQIGFIDRLIEKGFITYFHNKKPKIVRAFLESFSTAHPSQETQLIKVKLQKEANRVCDFTDRAIIRGNIKKLKYTFWAVAIGSTILVILLSGFKTPVNFIAPPVSAAITYLSGLAGIVALYNQRVKGAMNSTVKTYIAELENNNSQPLIENTINHGLQNDEQKAASNNQLSKSSTHIIIHNLPTTIHIQARNNSLMVSFQHPEQKNEHVVIDIVSSADELETSTADQLKIDQLHSQDHNYSPTPIVRWHY